jgi:uncharacterized protein (DUF433 family)
MAKDYVEKRGSSDYVVDSRIPIDTIVTAFLNDDTPETTRSSFPTLALQQVYGGILFYLENREAVENSMKVDEEALTKLNEEFRAKNPALFQKLRETKQASQFEKQR